MTASDRARGVLVTGAGGFVGHSVCRRLLSDGYRVKAIIRYDTPRDPGLVSTRLRVYKRDLLGDRGLDDLFNGCDCVVHAAGLAHGIREPWSPEALYRANSIATERLAQAALRAEVSRFVFLSSISVLGPYPGTPLTEDMPVRPVTAYAASKASAEARLWSAFENTSTFLTIIRPPLVYGRDAPGQFGRLLGWARRGWPLPLGCADGNARSLVDVRNLADLIEVSLSHAAAADEIFHVADGSPISTRELLQALANAAGHRPWLPRIHPAFLRTAATLLGCEDQLEALLGSHVVSLDKARDRLSWTPPMPMIEGLRDAVRGRD